MMYRDLSGEKAFAATQYEREREYWINKLSGELVKSSFPADVSTKAVKEKGRDSLSFKLPTHVFERLMVISNNSDSRLHMLLVTGLILLLYKYTGHTDIIICTPIDKQEVEGEFINTVLPLRSQLEEQMTVKEFLMQVKQTIIEASDNQNYPIETIPYELDIPVVEGDFPLFDTALLLENIQDKEYLRHINLQMIFSFLRTGESLEGIVEYNRSLFEKETIQRVINHYVYLVQEVFNRVDLKLIDVPVLTKEEKHRMVKDFNDTAADYPSDKMIHQLFEEQAEKKPGNTAVEFKGSRLTYKELNEKANQLARCLREKGIGTDDVVAVMLGSCIEVPIAIMAVLKAGGTYLPMGFEYPEERINYLLKDSTAKMLLTEKSLPDHMNLDCPMLYLEEKDLYTGECSNPVPPDNINPLAYIIYTSGTTGQPKGVMVEQRGLVNYIWWAARTYVKDEKVDFPLYTSISFDLTITSIFTPLITGNAIIVYGGVDKKFYIEDVIADNRVGVLKLTPSHLKLIRPKQLKDSAIKRLIVGGEELDTQLAMDIYHNFNEKIEIYNEYGPTETVVGSMIHKFDPDADNSPSVPIGVPIANTQVYLLNQHHQPVPVGVAAELYISGDGLARGYLRNPQLTEEKFVPNPFSAGKKMYRSGDLAVRLPNGNLEYKGRIDHQVKIRGYRVETGEIEAKIVSFQKISHAKREQREDIIKKLDLKSVTRCTTCLIPANYPGIYFEEKGMCNICREYESYKNKALKYFKTPKDFELVVEKAQKTKRSEYDCLMLYSGGKDSSYVLHRLVEMGLKVLAFTFDNGYISDMAFENIKRTTELLKVKSNIMDFGAMKEIFVESLWSDYNVCNGCFKAVNTFGTKIAHEHDINLVVSGLTRGQIFDIKLHGLFKLGIFNEETIDERLKLFRKNYHSMTHRTSRLIDEKITDKMLDNIYFSDYFRYDGISTSEIFEYLKAKDPGWVRPRDTGASSSNCIINDVGIYVHLKDKGFHFYSAQLSWDCRLGTITREEGVEEITGFKVDYPTAHKVLNEIGYYDAFTGAVVLPLADGKGEKALCAYIVAEKDFDVIGLKDYLSRELPDYMIPTYFTKIDRIPLTASGKIDQEALPEPELKYEGEYAAPRNKVEKKLSGIWKELLGIKQKSIGITTNFFEIGGHSLRATFLAAVIHKEFNVRVPLVKIFETPTIKGLAEYITEAAEETYTSIRPIEKKEYYVLSSAQSRLYILQQMDLESTAYNVNVIIEWSGESDRERLKKIFSKLTDSHESIRTSFEIIEGKPMQKIHNPSEVEFSIEYYDVTPASVSVPGTSSAANVINDFIRPFDLSQAPLMKVGLVKIQPLKYLMIVDMHHIITDGISHRILIQDFTALYSGNNLIPLKLQYKDYSEWQQNLAVREDLKKQKEYWLGEFQGEIPILNLSTDYTRMAVQNFEGSIVSFKLNMEKTTALKGIALSKEATLFMVLLAVYNIFLSKLDGKADIIVGTPLAGRKHTDLEKIIGAFINTLALRNYPEGEKSFSEFLSEVKEKTLETFENQDYPFEDLVDEIFVERNISHNPLFDVMFTLQNMFDAPVEIPEQEMKDLKLKPYSYRRGTAKFDLTLAAVELEGELHCRFEYKTKLFREESIRRFIRYFEKIISAIIENSGIKISAIEIISKEEKKRLLFDFNNTDAEYPQHKTVHQLFEEQAEKSPDQIALVGPSVRKVWSEYHSMPPKGSKEDTCQVVKAGDRFIWSLTYRELNRMSNQLAYLLRERSVKSNSIFGIMAERSLEMIIAMLAILKAGGAYLPIDPNYPEDRIQFMLSNSSAGVLVNTRTFSKEVEKVRNWGGMMCIIEDLLGNPVNNEQWATPHTQSETNRVNTFLAVGSENMQPVSTPMNLAYIIYTSGSTGKPKGVMVDHRSVVNTLLFRKEEYQMNIHDTNLQLFSYGFDAFVTSFFTPIISGSRVILVNQDDAADFIAIKDTITKHKVTHLICVPALYREIIENLNKEEAAFLKMVTLGGDKFSPNILEVTKDKNKNIEVINEYGVTEGAVISTIYRHQENHQKIKIGHPIWNVKIYIIDKKNKILPIGVSGELCIAGIGLAWGYLNNPELTNEKFLENSFVNGEKNGKFYKKVYRTGDLARWDSNGDLELLGRIDFQVKVRGIRIELGEIENQLVKHPEIKEAVVICREDESRNQYLCAYIVGLGTLPLTPLTPGSLEIKEYLSRTLPDYMIPSYFSYLDKIPLTPNGKIDRKALPIPEIKTNEGYISPGNELEEKLVGIWSEVLRVERHKIGIDTNFFQLGGHSLKATVMMAHIYKELNVKLPLAEIFKTPTIRHLSRTIKELKEDKYTSIRSVEEKEYYALSSAQKRLYFVQKLNKRDTSYNMSIILEFEGKPQREKFEETFRKMIKRHQILRTSLETIGEIPVQKIHRDVEFQVEYLKLESGFLDQWLKESEKIVKKFIRPFDLASAPLFRVGLIKIRETHHIFMLDMHHIISDGVSLQIFIKEFMILYGGKALPGLMHHYKDYAEWQNSNRQKEILMKQEKYWLKQLEGPLPLLDIPKDYTESPDASTEGKLIVFKINSQLTAKIKRFILETGTTLYMLLLAVYNILLSNYTRQKDILVGSPISGRKHPDLHTLIGMFVNMLVMRNNIGGSETFIEFLEKVKENALNAYENQDYQFDELVKKLGLQRGYDRNPIFNVTFQVQNIEGEKIDIEELEVLNQLRVKPYKFDRGKAAFDLILAATETMDYIVMSMLYSTKLFRCSTIEKMSEHYLEILEQVITNRDIKLNEIELSYNLVAMETRALEDGQSDFAF
ncbi:MAG: amino acid adenylation domain-containing protein [Candidatus Aminicenantes bacterium]|nr:MAG: amino acid adenylation domain-containing protein [Candidatus Aminicenantes bacterium]